MPQAAAILNNWHWWFYLKKKKKPPRLLIVKATEELEKGMEKNRAILTARKFIVLPRFSSFS